MKSSLLEPSGFQDTNGALYTVELCIDDGGLADVPACFKYRAPMLASPGALQPPYLQTCRITATCKAQYGDDPCQMLSLML